MFCKPINIYVFFVLLLSINSINCDLTTQQVSFFLSLSTTCSFTWQPSPTPSCASYVLYTGTSIKCVNGEVTEINIITPTSFTCQLTNSTYDKFNIFPQLKVLTFENIYLQGTFINLQTSATITKFGYIGNIEIPFIISSNFNMPKLTDLNLVYPTGTLPNNFNTSMESFKVIGTPGSFEANFPMSLLTPSLKTFQLIIYSEVLTPSKLPDNILSLTPNIISFEFGSIGYNASYETFKNPPVSCVVLGLYNLAMTTTDVPNIAQLGWNNLWGIVFVNLGIIGTVPDNYFQRPKVILLNFTSNSKLKVPLNLVSSSKLLHLYIAGTNSSGAIPDDFLDGGLEKFDGRTTELSGNLPPCIMCLPNLALTANSGPSYLIDGNTFSNYPQPGQPRLCNPVITSIEPSVLKTTDFYFSIKGTSLGSRISYLSLIMVNNVGETFSLSSYCSTVKISKEIRCINPKLQGNGTLSLLTLNDQNPPPTANFQFSYTKPFVSYVSPAPTLGGTITIYGDNLFSAVNAFSSITIGTTNCISPNIIAPNSIIECTYPPGIESKLPVIVNVKGNQNNYQTEVKFSYKSPSVKSSIYIKPNTDTRLTITGEDFWNDTSITSVSIEETPCSIISVNHTEIICDFPKTQFSPGLKSIVVKISQLISQPNSLFQMVDPGYCIGSCSNGGQCLPQIGFCSCSGPFAGPGCSQTTLETNEDIDGDLPILEASSESIDTSLFTQMMYLNQNGITVDLTDSDYWDSESNDTQTEYTFSKDSTTLKVTIRKNLNTGSDNIAGNVVNYPNNSYTYQVEYSSTVPVNNLRFGFRIEMTPEECEAPPYAYYYPTGINYGSSHLMTLQKFNTQWHARFPLIVVLNNGQSYGTISTEPSNNFGNYTEIIAYIQSDNVKNAKFQYDFTLLNSVANRDPVLTGCDLGEKVKDTSKSWKIAVGIAVPLGVICIATAAFFIVKQQRKINVTKKLLNQKLSELSQFR